jgi:GWxTD domain-containing protein
MTVHRFTRFLSVLIFGLASLSFAQSANTSAQAATKQDTSKPGSSQEVDPLKRELTPKQKEEQRKALQQEAKIYKKWLDEDVKWIITGEELEAFKKLSNNEERDNFIEQFWLRRDPTPDTVENEYKEEHYRRIAYANEHFAAGIAGWRTDRGQIYVKFGAPTSIDSHPSGGTYNRPIDEGGGTTSTYPFETWRYRYLEGTDLGNEVEIEFVDKCMCGEYKMTIDRSEKDALLYTPGGGATIFEEMGLANKADRFGGGPERLGTGPGSVNNTSKYFDRMRQMAALQAAPPVKFKDLDEVVKSTIRYNLMPFDVRVDFVKVTGDTILVPVTIQMKNRDITFATKDGVARGIVNIFGRVSTITGKTAQTFEDTVSVEIPESLLDKTKNNNSVYWKAFPLRYGNYKLDIVVKDVNSADGRMGTWRKGIPVPNMSEDRGLTSSTLILADQMEKVPTRQVGAGSFVIGNTKVRPRIEPAPGKPASFKKNEKLNVWMQVYNLGIDEKTKKSSAEIEYQVINTANNQPVMTTKENSAQIAANGGDQLTLEKSLPLADFAPGTYQVVIKVNDLVAKQTMPPATAKFVVEQPQ